MDKISLTLPAKSDYVLALRLFMSGVAARTNMSVDDIEDVKSAINEACVLLLTGVTKGGLAIEIELNQNAIDVRITAEGCEYNDERLDEVTFEISRMMLANLTVNSAITKDENGLFKDISMSFATLV